MFERFADLMDGEVGGPSPAAKLQEDLSTNTHE